MPAGGLVVGGIIGAGTAIYGAIEKSKAEKAARNNIMPQYTIPQSERDSLSLAESQAGQGMSDASRRELLNNSNQGLSATTNSILRAGGSANAIAGAENNYQQGLNQNAIYDDQARMSNLSRLQSAYTRASANSDKAYQINEYAPWANRAQAIAQQLQSGQQTMQSGLSTLGSAATSYAGSLAKPGTMQTPTTTPSSLPPVGQNQSYFAGSSGYDGNAGFGNGDINNGNNFTNMGNGQDPQFSWNGFYPSSQP